MADSIADSAFDLLIKIGFLNLIVPFILFYAIVFGMLEKTQLFANKDSKNKDESRNLHSLIAFALAITATAASYAVGITQNFLPVLGITSVVLLGFMMVVGMAFGSEFDNIAKGKFYRTTIAIAAAALMLGAVLVIAYNGLVVGTPCPMDGSLTPVNSLNPRAGECTDFIDLTPTAFYLMGFNIGEIGKQIFTGEILAIVIFIGVIGFTLYFVNKNR